MPRSEKVRKSLKPIYEKIPTWKEDISQCSSFEHLPPAAKTYVARMIQSTCEVAYGNRLDQEALPELLFIGVGPDPNQVIRDLPSLAELLDSSV